MSKQNKFSTNLWIAFAVIVFIILLFFWLTLAECTGNTDVAAFPIN